MTLPPVGAATCGLIPKLGWPLNHMSAPAASLAPETGAAGFGANSAGGVVPFGANSTLWNPRIRNDTLSPAWIVVRLG